LYGRLQRPPRHLPHFHYGQFILVHPIKIQNFDSFELKLTEI
jgi:hypothetical protein